MNENTLYELDEATRQRVYDQGYAEGYAQACVDGKSDADATAYAEIYAENYVYGYAKGEAKEKRATAQRMKAMGLDIQVIAEATQLTIEEIEKL